jgi:hypothetical protein
VFTSLGGSALEELILAAIFVFTQHRGLEELINTGVEAICGLYCVGRLSRLKTNSKDNLPLLALLSFEAFDLRDLPLCRTPRIQIRAGNQIIEKETCL